MKLKMKFMIVAFDAIWVKKSAGYFLILSRSHKPNMIPSMTVVVRIKY